MIQVYRGDRKIGSVPMPRPRPADQDINILVCNLQDTVARGIEVKIHAEDFDPEYIQCLLGGTYDSRTP